MTGVEVDGLQLTGRVGSDGAHEAERIGDGSDNSLVLGFDGSGLDVT